MPERLNVVRLSDDEKAVLTDSVRPQHIEAVFREVKASLKGSADAVQAAAKAPDLDAGTLRAAQKTLGDRRQLLGALPAGEAQQKAVQATSEALGMVEEAIGMLDQ
ncbi:MAG: hypothetical protein L0H93_21075 [Nocardioides sp.]|nr:hypothetical protein [Nocardioides sp.]